MVFMMRVAISQWQGRVSPVFDVAGNLLISEVLEGREIGRQEIALIATDAIERTRQVAQLQVDVLICGAVSSSLEMALSSAGVRVIPRTCGRVEDVLRAFVSGRLADNAFLMPGCFHMAGSCQGGRGHVGRKPGAGERNGRGRKSRTRRRGGGHRGRGN